MFDKRGYIIVIFCNKIIFYDQVYITTNLFKAASTW